jgi:hypothetical protein
MHGSELCITRKLQLAAYLPKKEKKKKNILGR